MGYASARAVWPTCPLPRTLPDLDGLHIAKDLRELGTAPVLIVTARATASDELHGMAAGASAYLTKPFHARDLREAINELYPENSGASSGLHTSGRRLVVLVAVGQQQRVADGVATCFRRNRREHEARSEAPPDRQALTNETMPRARRRGAVSVWRPGMWSRSTLVET